MKFAPLLLVLTLLCAPFQSAQAYIDPGAASIVLQSLIAAAAAAFVLLRGWGASFRKFIRRLLVRRHRDLPDVRVRVRCG